MSFIFCLLHLVLSYYTFAKVVLSRFKAEVELPPPGHSLGPQAGQIANGLPFIFAGVRFFDGLEGVCAPLDNQLGHFVPKTLRHRRRNKFVRFDLRDFCARMIFESQ